MLLKARSYNNALMRDLYLWNTSYLRSSMARKYTTKYTLSDYKYVAKRITLSSMQIEYYVCFPDIHTFDNVLFLSSTNDFQVINVILPCDTKS